METEPSPDHDEDLIEEDIQDEDDLDYVDIQGTQPDFKPRVQKLQQISKREDIEQISSYLADAKLSPRSPRKFSQSYSMSQSQSFKICQDWQCQTDNLAESMPDPAIASLEQTQNTDFMETSMRNIPSKSLTNSAARRKRSQKGVDSLHRRWSRVSEDDVSSQLSSSNSIIKIPKIVKAEHSLIDTQQMISQEELKQLTPSMKKKQKSLIMRRRSLSLRLAKANLNAHSPPPKNFTHMNPTTSPEIPNFANIYDL